MPRKSTVRRANVVFFVGLVQAWSGVGSSVAKSTHGFVWPRKVGYLWLRSWLLAQKVDETTNLKLFIF